MKGTLGCEGEISCLSIGGNNSIVPLCISLSFPSSINISSIVKSTNELLLNSSNVLLLLWMECIDNFRSGLDVAGVAKLLLICGIKEFLLFGKLFWLNNTLPLGEIVWKLNCDCTFVSKFFYNKHSFVYVLKLWEEVWIFAFNLSHTLNYSTLLAKRMRGNFRTPGVTQGNFGLTFLPHPLD